MTISCQIGDADIHGATVAAQAPSLESEHQAIVRELAATSKDPGAANAHGQKIQTAGSNMAAPTAPSALAGPNCTSQHLR